ncbi:MAG TPA: PrsW family glutamic-type intramembrane protease [Methanomassiliicoccales archaeon]|jgi:RsiW-degrading membrane proteinase PrsW (M82 family)
MVDFIGLVLVVIVSVTPPILYLIWVRNAELCRRESMGSVLMAFAFAAVVSLSAAFIIESFLVGTLFSPGSVLNQGFWGIQPNDQNLQLLILAVFIAPIVEEFTKSWAVLFMSPRLNEIEDGLVYGAAAGLGFAAVENILYNGSALVSGTEVFLVIAISRALTSTLLHASATAVTGYGIALSKFHRMAGHPQSWVLYYAGAVVLHASFNLFAIMGNFTSDVAFVSLIGLILSFLLAWIVFTWIRSSIQRLDRVNGCLR